MSAGGASSQGAADEPGDDAAGPGDVAAPLSLADAQRAVDAWIGQFRDGYWPPLANLARLIEEVGELARELNHLYGPKTKKTGEPERELALELGDVLFVLLALANEQKVDMTAAFREVLEKYRTRDAERWQRP